MNVTITLDENSNKAMELYAIKNGLLDGQQAPDVTAAVQMIIDKNSSSFLRQEHRKIQEEKPIEDIVTEVTEAEA